MNLPNYTYRPIAVSSLFTAHNSQAENYAFASKERDAETGLSVTSLRSVSSLPLGHFRTSSNGTRWLRRFGARYYSSELIIWLSVDPMVDKYPSFSPYTYCANNPIKLVDPNGEEFGDFYDFNGTYLGTDGKDDEKVYLVQGHSADYVNNNRKNKMNTSADDPNITISQSTTYSDLNKALEILDMPNGQKEEGGAFDNNGKWHQGEGCSDHVKLPISKGKTTIHRHTWGKPDERNGYYRSPENPSGKDLESFMNFEQNIIVGKNEGSYDSFSGFQERKDIISFYGNTRKTPNCTITREAAQKIVDRGKRIGRIN